MRSIRTALIVGATIGIAAILLVSDSLLYALARASLVKQFDLSLVDKAGLLASAVERKSRKIVCDFGEIGMDEFQTKRRPSYLQVRGSDGSTFFRSVSLGTSNLAPVAGASAVPAFGWVKLPNGRAGRAVGIVFEPRIDEGDSEAGDSGRKDSRGRGGAIELVLARDTDPIEDTLARLRTLLASIGFLTIAISVGALSLIVQRGLRPLRHVASQIGGLCEEDLSARIDARGAPRELRPVVDRLNDLLRRLEAAFQRERSFSSDAAHELRTPLAGLRSTMEVALSRTRQAGEYRETLRDCLQIAIRMQAMVENLLSLARLEADQVKVNPAPLLLDDLVRDSWAPLRESAGARRLRVEWRLGVEGPVISDPSLLGAVIRNVLENAIAHADEGGEVAIETFPDGGAPAFRVTNSGSLLAQDQVERLFERFWRGDAARSAVGVHCGLGLSLVKKIVAVLGGTIEAQSSVGGPFEITIRLPAS